MENHRVSRFKALFTGLVCLISYTNALSYEFAGGTGEPNDPYQIATAEQLISIGSDPNLLDKHYILINDLDLDPNLPGGQVFDRAVIAPDLDETTSCFQGMVFQGCFDGQGHKITGLTIVTPHDYVGLFGTIGYEASVINLGVENVSIISTVQIPPPPTGGGGRCGVAALAGESLGVVANCYSTGLIDGTFEVAGLIGENKGIISNCYSTATATGYSSAGGLVGKNHSGVILHCYARGYTSGKSSLSKVGGLVGMNSGGTIVDSYFLDPNDGGGPNNNLGNTLTDEQMKQSRHFLGWDFYGSDEEGEVNMWFMVEDSYPALAWETEKSGLTWLPGVRGKSLEDTLSIIHDVDLVVGTTIYTYDPYIPKDQVINLRPRHPVTPGMVVDVMVSLGSYHWQENPGVGNEEAPYELSEYTHLEALALRPDLWDKSFVLTNDIDLSGRVYTQTLLAPDTNDSEFNFQGIMFEGHMDGQGHHVVGYTLLSASEYAGLFGKIGSKGRVSNLGMQDVRIVGRVRSFSSECSGPGSPSGGGGGGRSGAGGLVAENTGIVANSFSRGSVIGTTKVGGLVGENKGEIMNCYSHAVVDGMTLSGGLVGLNYETIIRSYAIGRVTGQEAGGLAGHSNGFVIDCFWTVESNGYLNHLGRGVDTEQMKSVRLLSFNGWGEDSSWILDDGNDYPRLFWENSPGQVISQPVMSWLEGQGTFQDPYRISTAEQFSQIGTASILWDKSFLLTDDIDLSNHEPLPIGICRGTAFLGHFNGDGHSISGFTHDSTYVKSYQGLFGYIEKGGIIHDLGIRNAFVAGKDYIGALTGYNAGTINRCFATGEVVGRNILGLLIGYNTGFIDQCYSTGFITGQNQLGGLIGIHHDNTIARCYSTATVSSYEYAYDIGGLIGDNRGNIIYCYYLSNPYLDSPWLFKGIPLTESQMLDLGSFEGWGFYNLIDGKPNHWYMPAQSPPILSWQTQESGLNIIPEVKGLSLEQARTRLESKGFIIGNIQYDYQKSIIENSIIYTNPQFYASTGTAIDLVLSQGVYDWNQNPGDGTLHSPYQLETAGQLESITDHPELLDKAFVLNNSISLNRKEYSESFFPGQFRGNFDGKGYAITHFTSWGAGFFERIGKEGRVHNLKLRWVNIMGRAGGAFVTQNTGEISFCAVTGRIVGSSGMVGVNSGSVINSYVNADLFSMDSTRGWGGMVGKNNGTIQECYAQVTMSTQGATWGVGAIAGENNDTVKNCWANLHFNTFESTWDIGGLVGENNGTVMHCHARALHVNDFFDRRYGQLIGKSSGIIISSYFPAFLTNNGLGTELTQEQSSQQSSYVDWNFESTWTMCFVPFLRWEGINCDD